MAPNRFGQWLDRKMRERGVVSQRELAPPARPGPSSSRRASDARFSSHFTPALAFQHRDNQDSVGLHLGYGPASLVVIP